MATHELFERYKGFRYLLELEGVPRAAFGACAGLAEAHRPVEFYISDDEPVDLIEILETEHPVHLILAEGVAFDQAVYAWQRSASEGEPASQDGSIVEMDGFGHPCRIYRFRGARPVFYQGVLAVGAHAEYHIATLELSYDVLTKN
ncbi:MAG: phage tail protein [Oscillochloridaceae bacterium umkhey_bin13]